MASFEEYHRYLVDHPNARTEIWAAIDALVTNETYLFREGQQLRAFETEILPDLRDRIVAARRKTLTVWSAGCSTGEEVYSIAILIDRSGLFDGWTVRVFGNDISGRVIPIAERGIYGPSSFRAMPAEYDPYFVADPDGRRVAPHIRSMCHFDHLNLLDRAGSSVVGRVDAVFCRNVIIYLDDEARGRVIGSLHDRLYPGGYLFLGHSESLLNANTAFEPVHLQTTIVYRRGASGGIR